MKEIFLTAIGFILILIGGLGMDNAFIIPCIMVAAGLIILLIEGRKYGDII